MVLLNEIGEKSKIASIKLNKLKTSEKNKLLIDISEELERNYDKILYSNKIDVDEATKNGVKSSFIDRLTLNKKRLDDIKDSFINIAKLEDPIGEIISTKTLENGLVIAQKRVSIGVIGIIYESRPNVTADAFALCLKVSSSVVLRGGKEAFNTNKILVDIFRKTIQENNFDPNFVQLIEDTTREVTHEFMKLNKYIDLLIPRGSQSLIQATIENSTIPVIQTGVGNCHIFVDSSADFEMATKIIINAKTQRPGVCNACESLLIHKDIVNKYLPIITNELRKYNVEVRGDEDCIKIVPDISKATDEDYFTEYADLIISIKIVNNIDYAIEHISIYGTKHSESIITESYSAAQKFLNEVDAAAVYVNASTRFTDGFEFGFGAEIGISTQKLHARGPMGLKEITSYKYIVYGTGQTRL